MNRILETYLLTVFRKLNILPLFLLPAIIFMSCNSGENSNSGEEYTLNIFSAAGMREVNEKLCENFEKAFDCKTARNYASSGLLARQIENGAVCDIFISADSVWIAHLVQKGMLDTANIAFLAGNSLAVICPKEYNKVCPVFIPGYDISSCLPAKIAIGDPGYVPVGRYASFLLDSLQWSSALEDRMILTRDVSSVLRIVESGDCDWGIVYYTEAVKSDKIKILAKIEESLHPPVRFYIGLLNTADSVAGQFAAYYRNEKGKSFLREAGFISK